jgi:hypothetical protein
MPERSRSARRGRWRLRAPPGVGAARRARGAGTRVLQRHAVAYPCARLDEHAFADVAVRPDHGAAHHVRKGPHASAGAYGIALAESVGVDVERHGDRFINIAAALATET